MKKAMLLFLCVALSAMALSCLSGGGSGGAAGLEAPVPATGEWLTFTDVNDGGTSTINMQQTQVDGQTAYRFTGSITTNFVYGFTGWAIEVDEETLANLKIATAISFMTRGDGKRYTVKYRISSVRDHAFHEFHFIAGPEAERIEVPIRMFMQPSWGTSVRMNQNNVQDISWQTHESWRPGDYDITIWDVQIH